jgi:hypothetical protein
MKVQLQLLFLFAFFTCIANLNAQQAALFNKTEIKNFHQEMFQVGIASENSFPYHGSFIDFEGNTYLYGEYQGQGNTNKIDNIFINELKSGKFFIVKFNQYNQAQWGYIFGSSPSMSELKIIQGPDSLLYLFASSQDIFSIGSFTIPKNTISIERSTFVVRIDPKTGSPIDGRTLPENYINYSWFLQDAIFDDAGNLYIALQSFKAASPKPDSIRFGNLAAYWRNNSKTSSKMAIVTKLDKNLNPIWMHTIGAVNRATIKLSYVNNELVVCGYGQIDDQQWKKLYFDDELLTDVDFNSPNSQINNGFLIKLDSNGVKKWMFHG